MSRGTSSLPAWPRSSERGGGGVSGLSSVELEHTSVSSAPSGAAEGKLLVRSGRPLPTPLPQLLLPVLHRTLDDVKNWEMFRRTAPVFDPPVVPDLRIEEHGRIGELARGRTALMTVAVALALAPLTVRSQEGESVEGSRLLGRCPPASGRVACALVLGETGLAVTGHGLLTATDHVNSVRVPLFAGELAVT